MKGTPQHVAGVYFGMQAAMLMLASRNFDMLMCLPIAQYGLCLLLPMCVLLVACRSSGDL